MAWTDNSIMFWFDTQTGTFRKISDHNRSPLKVSIERIENKQRMADGTLRRYVVAKKRAWSCSWEKLPSRASAPATALKTVDGGMGGDDLEDFHNRTDGSFQMQLRDGAGTIQTVTVMITDFSKEIAKRGTTDLWNCDVTLEEV